ncbi:integral membrane protein [Hortaea werneckii]|nr:integral membrane protein [Hortaea werneckii]
MRSWLSAGLALLQLATVSQAIEMKIDQKEKNRQVCSGMYSRKSWGGNTEPFIMTKFLKPDDIAEGADPLVSFVVFEWRDQALVGKPENEVSAGGEVVPDANRAFICDQTNVDAGFCSKDDVGSFILADNATDVSKSEIISETIHLKDPKAVNYHIAHTGYYCVGTYAFSEHDYTAVVEFRNAFGELPAAQIAKLPFYAAITVVYAFLAIGWGALYYLNRHDILPVQNYITAILVFLVVEMFMTWLFYDYQNRNGFNTGAKAIMIVDSVLQAARNSFSFFLLLIVCMGYGVVKPSLGKTMVYVRWLAITHFVFGVLYSVASLSVTPENAGPLILLVVLPLAGTLTAFYVWTLNSLNVTMKDLMERKQTIKAGMYRRLWWCILLSIIVIFAFFFINSWTFAGVDQDEFVPQHWQTRWFILDGWLNLVYFADVAFVAYIWRPTANNRRFAMSDEIAQDDDGFEIASIRDSFDIDLEDPDSDNGPGNTKPPAYDAPRERRESERRDQSPLPAPVPQKPRSSLPAEDLEGETMFALGEQSDEESGDEEERKGLTAGSKKD